MPFAWRPSLVPALIISLFVGPPACSAEPGPRLQKEAEQDGEPKPGIRSWTQFRGDMHGTGFSHSPRPKLKGLKWKYFTGGAITSTPVVANGILFAATETGYVHAIDTSTGKKVWNSTLGAGGVGQGVVHTSPLWYDGRLYFGTKPGKLYCLSDKDGETLWVKQLTHKQDRIDSAVPIYSSPKGDHRGIVVPTMSGEIWCLDPKTGKERWKVETSREMGGTAVIVGDLVYVVTKGRLLYEIDYGTGKTLRRIPLPGTTHCSPAYGLGYLFLTLGDNQCVAVDLVPPRPGAEPRSAVLWNIKAEGRPRNAMTYHDGVMYVRNRATVLAANAHSGKALWSAQLTYKPADPLLVADLVLIAHKRGHLKAVRASDGQEVFAMDLGYKIHQGPIVVDGIIYQATTDNFILAIE